MPEEENKELNWAAPPSGPLTQLSPIDVDRWKKHLERNPLPVVDRPPSPYRTLPRPPVPPDVNGGAARATGYHVYQPLPHHDHMHPWQYANGGMIRAPWPSLRTLAATFGPRPPLIAPVSRHAVGAGMAALVETNLRMKPNGETLRDRPSWDLAKTVLEAAGPFIQRDLLHRVAGDRLWRHGWLMLGHVAALVAFAAAAGFAAGQSATWLLILIGCAAFLLTAGWWQLSASNRRQRQRARTLLDKPLTGTPPADDPAAETVDLHRAGD